MKRIVLAIPALLIATVAQGQVVRVSADNFNANAGVITFSELALGTVNPSYTAAQYGGNASAPTVSFGGFFAGQSLSANPSVDCPGGAASACVVGSATNSLSLSPTAPSTFIVGDSSNPTSPVLSGSPRFNGPVSVLFSTDQVAVGFDGGFFDAVQSTGIVAFARDGTVLGTISNFTTGIEFLGLAVADGSAKIAGVGLRLTGNEPAGFAIDNLRFGTSGQITVPSVPTVPEPATWAMMLVGFGMVAGAARYRRRSTTAAIA